MKLIVEIAETPWHELVALKVKSTKELYDKYFNKDGFLYNEEFESIYYEIEAPYVPTEGQRVSTKFGMRIVDWSILSLNETYFGYNNLSRIIVKPE
jgi:hypothetical protein